jgi:hypothetical protein
MFNVSPYNPTRIVIITPNISASHNSIRLSVEDYSAFEDAQDLLVIMMVTI